MAKPKLREKLNILGADQLSVQELLAIVIGSGGRGKSAIQLAEELIQSRDGALGLSSTSTADLMTHSGCGFAKATRIIAAVELGRRTFDARGTPTSLLTPEDIFELCRSRVTGKSTESLWVLGLSSQNELVCDMEVAKGGSSQTSLHPKDVLAPLIRCHAAAFVLVHNHPSGDSSPSAADVAFTQEMTASGQLIGIPLLDHIIVTADSFHSLRNICSR